MRTTTRSGAAGSASATAGTPVASPELAYRRVYALSAPLRDPAFAALPGGRFALIGGLDAADVSTSEVLLGDGHGARSVASLALAQHDAQAATLGGRVYVFGGGSATELDHVLSVDPAGGAVATVGRLPRAQSDVAVATVGDAAYVIGGYDGTSWLDTVLSWQPGRSPAVAGHLPVGLRYAAAAVAPNGRIVILGGSTPTGASRAILSFDPGTGRTEAIGRLPHPITHAVAATLGSSVYLIGGRGDSLGTQTSTILAVDPGTGKVRPAGRLPVPLSDSAAIATGNAIILAGGLTPTHTVADVGELLPAQPR